MPRRGVPLKGARFESFRNPPSPTGNAKPRYVFRPHQGRKERIRILKQRCRGLLNSKDPDVIAAGKRIIEACKGLDDLELRILTLMSIALDHAESTEATYAQAVDVLLEQAAEERARQEALKAAQAEKPVEASTRVDDVHVEKVASAETTVNS